MTDASTIPSIVEPLPGLSVVVSDDRLLASIRAEPSTLGRTWPVEMLRTLLARHRILIDAEVDIILRRLGPLSTRPARKDVFEVRRGKPPTAGTPAQLTLDVAPGQFVRAGDLIGTIIPATRGENGIDVSGLPIDAAPADLNLPALPDGTRFDAADNTVVAAREGLFSTDAVGTRAIEPAEVFERDLDANSPTVDSAQSIYCHGGMRGGGTARSARSLVLEGAIEASHAHAGLDLRIGLGLVCRGDKGSAVAGRNVFAKYIHHARVLAGADVHVEAELLNSHIECGGRLVAPGATLIGGVIRCPLGASLRTIGSPVQNRTTLVLGCDVSFDRLFKDLWPVIEAYRHNIKDAHVALMPLIENHANLTPRQREKSAELSQDIGTLQHDLDALLAALRLAMSRSAPRLEATLDVQHMIYPNTMLRFAGVETTLRTALRGPVRLIAHGTGSKRQILAHHHNGTGHPVDAKPIVGDPLCAAQRLLAA
jgi:uncharacterized protein